MASGPVLAVHSSSPDTGIVMLHKYSCSPSADWTFTPVGKTAAGGTIGMISAGCSGTDAVTGTPFTMSYAYSARSYYAKNGQGGGRAGWRWQVTGGWLEVVQQAASDGVEHR